MIMFFWGYLYLSITFLLNLQLIKYCNPKICENGKLF